MLRPLRLLPLLLALPGLAAAQPDSVRTAPHGHSTGAVVGRQALYGTLSGAAGGGLMMLAFAGLSGCLDGEDDTPDDEDSDSDIDGCLLPLVTGAFASLMTYPVVSGMVVAFTGDAMDRRGSLVWSIIGGCLGGLAGGLALAGIEDPEYLAGIGFLAGTQLGAIGFYHLTDDVRPTLSLAPARDGAGGRGAFLRGLRPGVEFTLARF